MRLEAKQQASGVSSKSKLKLPSPKKAFTKGALTGHISASKSSLPSPSVGVKPCFPKKGRKAFVCPQKKIEKIEEES